MKARKQQKINAELKAIENLKELKKALEDYRKTHHKQ